MVDFVLTANKRVNPLRKNYKHTLAVKHSHPNSHQFASSPPLVRASLRQAGLQRVPTIILLPMEGFVIPSIKSAPVGTHCNACLPRWINKNNFYRQKITQVDCLVLRKYDLCLHLDLVLRHRQSL